MKGVRLDDNGIPILSRSDIEIRVEKFIRYFDANCLLEPSFTPLATICTRLHEDHNVSFVFGQNLGETPEGYKYRGQFDIPSQTILIDKSLEEGSPPFNFTLAHELGHFVFHRNIDTSILKREKGETIKDTGRDLVLDQLQSDNPRTWMEWQANKFASSLLMPRSTVPKAVKRKQNEMGIKRNAGKIYLNRGGGSLIDFKEQIDSLKLIYQSSPSSIRIRLKELGILFESEDASRTGSSLGGPSHVNDCIMDMFSGQ